MRALLILLSISIVSGCVPYSTTPLEQTILNAVGYASISGQVGRTKEEKQIKAMRASKYDAYQELAEQVYGVRVSGRFNLNQQSLSGESTSGMSDGLIRGAEVIRSYPVGDNYITELRLDMDKVHALQERFGEVHEITEQKSNTLF